MCSSIAVDFNARLLLALISLTWVGGASASDLDVPACRLDDSKAAAVKQATASALEGYRLIGKSLPYVGLAVNAQRESGSNELTILIIKDATAKQLNATGCIANNARSGEPLDPLSVRGGCFVVSDRKSQIRCSADAVNIFGAVGSRGDRANPALLYVLAHELGHNYQRRPGDYAGRVESIRLQDRKSVKLASLRAQCQPVLTKVESEADAMALEVMKRQLVKSPYRETVFTERGSMLWNTDQLAIASNAWQERALEREFTGQSNPHPAFVARELPSSQRTINANASRFVCDVLQKTTGTIAFPAKSSSHPTPDQRLRLLAVGIKGVADKLPSTGGLQDFQAVARLQADLSPVFTHIYREAGIYLEKVQDKICTIANSADPEASCR